MSSETENPLINGLTLIKGTARSSQRPSKWYIYDLDLQVAGKFIDKKYRSYDCKSHEMLLAVWLARLSDYVTVVLRKKKLVKHG
jgi:hypothetical protein